MVLGEKRIQVVITSGLECCFLVTVFTGMRYLFAGIPTRPFAILYIMHSFASFLHYFSVFNVSCRTSR